MSYGILLLRIGAGGTIAAHGTQKLFGWFGGGGPKGTAGFFGGMGFRAPVVLALLAGLGESSGAAFAFGFLTPLAAVGMATVMLVAIITVHWKNGFFNGNAGFEFPLLIATAAVAVAATGPGRFSVDHALGWDDNLSGLSWGIGVAAVAAVTATVVVTTLREKNRGAQI